MDEWAVLVASVGCQGRAVLRRVQTRRGDEERDAREKDNQPIVRTIVWDDSLKRDVQHGLMLVSR